MALNKRKYSFFLILGVFFFSPLSGRSLVLADTVDAACYLTEAVEYFKTGEFLQASDSYRMAITVSGGAPEWSGSITSHLGITSCFFNLDEQDSLEKYLHLTETLISSFKAKNDDLAVFYNLYGAFCYLKGDLEKWLESSHCGLELNGIAPNLQFTFYQHAAEIYRTKGDFEQSVRYANYALNMPNLARFGGLRDIYNMNNTLGGTYYQLGQYDLAIATFENNLQLLNTVNAPHLAEHYISTHNGLATAYMGSHDYAAALSQLREAQRIHRSYAANQEETWHNLGILYMEMGENQLDSARFYLLHAVNKNLEDEVFDFVNVAREYRLLGDIAAQGDSAEVALLYFQKAIGVLTEKGFQPDWRKTPSREEVKSETELLAVCWAKGRLLQKMADISPENTESHLQAAYDNYQFCIELIDSMRKGYHDESKKFWNEQIHPIFENAVLVAVQLFKLTGKYAYLNNAFQFAEKSKTVILAEAVRASMAKHAGGISPKLLDQEKELKMNIATYHRKIFMEKQEGGKADNKKIQFWRGKILEFERQYEELRRQMEINFPEYFRLRYNTKVVDIRAIQNSLKKNAECVTYILSEKEIIIFGITPHQAKVEIVPLPEDFSLEFEAYISDLRDHRKVAASALDSSYFHHFAEQSSYLFELLLQPVLSEDIEFLTVVPDGILGYLPFELLLPKLPAADQTPDYRALDYLLRQACVNYEYSATLALEKPDVRPGKLKFAGYAPSYSSVGHVPVDHSADDCLGPEIDDFSLLHNNQAEVNYIAKLLGGEAYCGAGVSESLFHRTSKGASILHFAMHAFLNDCDPLYSGLVFAENDTAPGDDFLHAYEIYNLDLHADLAVLSACNSGYGQFRQGEGIMSLARAFRYAGCANILMSLWPAEDDATDRMMAAFYQGLNRGEGKADALREAKLNFLAESASNHPIYWAEFVLVGDNLPIKEKTPWGYLGVVILFVVLGIALIRKNRIRFSFRE